MFSVGSGVGESKSRPYSKFGLSKTPKYWRLSHLYLVFSIRVWYIQQRSSNSAISGVEKSGSSKSTVQIGIHSDQYRTNIPPIPTRYCDYRFSLTATATATASSPFRPLHVPGATRRAFATAPQLFSLSHFDPMRGRPDEGGGQTDSRPRPRRRSSNKSVRDHSLGATPTVSVRLSGPRTAVGRRACTDARANLDSIL